MFKKILIANRGEIACRVIKTAQNMGVESVAVYSNVDRRAMHVRMADESVCIGGAASVDSYLKGDVIIKAAIDCGAQAIHPGYGFLSENAEFASACADAGLIFIGPSPDSISAMGLKDCAKDLMNKAGVPVVPGYQGDEQGNDFLSRKASEIGYPVLIKAVAGGGGKGMRLVENSQNFNELLDICRREALAAFGNEHVLIEKYLTQPRHIEVQIFGDSHGNVVHLFERDCSLQRRHQKVVEEAPAPNISDEFRDNICNAAVRAAKSIDYQGAGTVEFIVQGDAFYFMEMNTRLQVEHPVTEMITGQDLVEWQLRVAAGETLPLAQDDIAINGHAFESRLYAEDPSQDFLPQTGCVHQFNFPSQSLYMRVDTGVEAGDEVSIHYDSMVAKLISWGDDRAQAAQNMADLLGHTYMAGLPSNQEFISNVFNHDEFLNANIDTGFIKCHEQDLMSESYGKADDTDIVLASLIYILGLNRPKAEQNPWDTHDNWRIGGDVLRRDIKLVSKGEVIEISALCHAMCLDLLGIADATLISYSNNVITALIDDVKVCAKILSYRDAITIFHNGRVVDVHLFVPEVDDDHAGAGDGRIVAPMPGGVVRVIAVAGDFVKKGDLLIVIESMKVQIPIVAGCDGVINDVLVEENAQVSDGTLLVEITPQEDRS